MRILHFHDLIKKGIHTWSVDLKKKPPNNSTIK